MHDIYLIGNSHIDLAWLWQWQEGWSEVLSTFRSALDRMKEFPDFKYTCANAVHYQWVEQTDPAMFEEIRQRVKEGRWNIVGGWMLQPDCNLPCAESFARHALIAQRYFKDQFGTIARTGYNVDSFGHNANLPKLLRASGMENYVFMRPKANEKTDLPGSLFWWEADDGSRVCAYRIPERYNIGPDFLHLVDAIADLAQSENRDLMAFYGVGNHGGGPTIQLIEALQNKAIPGSRFASVDDYFAQVDKSDLPTVQDELQHHARGCYSAYAPIKMGNRRSEQNLLAAERFSLMAKVLLGLDYPREELNKGWYNVLFNQFHDIMGGCCIEKAYTDAKYLHDETLAITDRLINRALQAIAWNIDTLQGETLPGYFPSGSRIWHHEVLGTPLVVFNPHAWPVTALVSTYAAATCVTDAQGNEIPFQLIHADNNLKAEGVVHTAFLAQVPAMGYQVYRLFMERPSHLAGASPMKISRLHMENDCLTVDFDPVTGDVCRIVDKATQTLWLDRPCRALLLDETPCDTWAHNVTWLGPEVASFSNADFMIVEEGPVQVTLRTTVRCGHSTLIRDFTLMRGSREIHVKATVDFHEKHRTLKLAFPMKGEQITTAIPYGTITRPAETGEEPCGPWFTDGCMLIANDGQYGCDATKGEMRLTILRGAAFADHCSVRSAFTTYMDQGPHTFGYTLSPYEGIPAAEKTAALLNCPVKTIKTAFHHGNLAEIYEGYAGGNPQVVVAAAKQHEDSSQNILRIYNTGDEEAAYSATVFGKAYETLLPPHGMQTLCEDGRQFNLLEWE